jgi:hypothetical protein
MGELSMSSESIEHPDDVLDHWQKDGAFDDTELDAASLQIPMLHGRYLRFLSASRLRVRRLEEQRRQLENFLRSYYLGDLNDPALLSTHGRQPMLKRHLKAEVGPLIAADEEMCKFNVGFNVATEVVIVLEEILKQINNRGFQIKNAIEWRKLTQFSQL